jgi:nucleotidyltransferase/DNA polymerase involved in DNA repair
MNYAAKKKGVKRSMTAYEALEACPDCIFVHIATIEVRTEWQGRTNEQLADLQAKMKANH